MGFPCRLVTARSAGIKPRLQWMSRLYPGTEKPKLQPEPAGHELAGSGGRLVYSLGRMSIAKMNLSKAVPHICEESVLRDQSIMSAQALSGERGEYEVTVTQKSTCPKTEFPRGTQFQRGVSMRMMHGRKGFLMPLGGTPGASTRTGKTAFQKRAASSPSSIFPSEPSDCDRRQRPTTGYPPSLTETSTSTVLPTKSLPFGAFN